MLLLIINYDNFWLSIDCSYSWHNDMVTQQHVSDMILVVWLCCINYFPLAFSSSFQQCAVCGSNVSSSTNAVLVGAVTMAPCRYKCDIDSVSWFNQSQALIIVMCRIPWSLGCDALLELHWGRMICCRAPTTTPYQNIFYTQIEVNLKHYLSG